jgi:ribonuclease P protein component
VLHGSFAVCRACSGSPDRTQIRCDHLAPKTTGRRDETDLPAEQPTAEEGARLSRPYGEPDRPPSHQASPSQRAQAPERVRPGQAARLSARVVGNQPTTRSQTLPTAARVRKRREFLAIQRGGRRLPARHFLVVASQGSGESARLGVTVTRKVGGAVERNRLKRAVREVFRRQRSLLPGGLSLVVIAREGATGLAGGAIAAEIEPLFASLAMGDRPVQTSPASSAE